MVNLLGLNRNEVVVSKKYLRSVAQIAHSAKPVPDLPKLTQIGPDYLKLGAAGPDLLTQKVLLKN